MELRLVKVTGRAVACMPVSSVALRGEAKDPVFELIGMPL